MVQSSMAFSIPSQTRSIVEEHAVRAYPRESCGVLLGAQSSVREAIPCTNEITDRADRYRIPAAELIAAQKHARAQGLDIIGFYHSHPDHPAQPSSTDLAEAHWFGCLYAIVSVVNGMAREIRAFQLQGDEQHKYFSEVQLGS
jgi:proteasome lid subunit RPN8/RPN11